MMIETLSIVLFAMSGIFMVGVLISQSVGVKLTSALQTQQVEDLKWHDDRDNHSPETMSTYLVVSLHERTRLRWLIVIFKEITVILSVSTAIAFVCGLIAAFL